MLSVEALLFTLGCALGWALLDLVRKLLSSSASAVATTFLLVVGQIPLFAIWVSFEGWALPLAPYWLPGLGVVVLNLLANLAFMQSVRTAPMSRTVPLLSLTPVFATLVAIPIFSEWPTTLQALGIAAVVVSALVVARGSYSGSDDDGFAKTLFQRGGLLMAFVAICWSVTPSLDKLAMRQTSPAMHALLVVVGIAIGLACVAWQQSQGSEVLSLLTTRRALLLTLLAVSVGAFASGVQLLAYQQAPVGLVETVKRGAGAALALFFGRWVFQEKIGWSRVLAVAVMIAGVAMVIMG